jgi:hypothetical protein
MKSINNSQLFTEITAEESAAINGGCNFFQPVSNWIQEQAKKAAEEAQKAYQAYLNSQKLIKRFRQTGRFW